MTNEQLRNLILSINIQVKDDCQAGIKITKYKLPEVALSDAVVEALHANFEHYGSISIQGNILTLVHPEQDDE